MNTDRKTALVCGAGGFIGSHMVKRLKKEGYWVRGVDIKEPEFSYTEADDFVIGNLTVQSIARAVIDRTFDEVYQFAADMGGAGYIFTGDHDADVMDNSATVNLNIIRRIKDWNEEHNVNKTKIFFSSSACAYPEYIQLDPENPGLKEENAYPAEPDSEYGWEKLFSERLYLAYSRNYGIPVRIARYHNIFGPEGTWNGGREKAPAAICRKVAELPKQGGSIEVWGDGLQTRSFLFVDECVEATYRLVQSDFSGPVNIGSEEMVSINELVDIAAKVSGKKVEKNHIEGPLGVRGRNSNNDLIREKLGWDYSMTLEEGISKTYNWIDDQLSAII
ncbi:MAG: NAD-dependent epimerase/dehydratase family protein [Pseudomonadota bacterium]|nr:NAD-dependent epimerase/dehydratase family protein [Pseudomonadota bacterium]